MFLVTFYQKACYRLLRSDTGFKTYKALSTLNRFSIKQHLHLKIVFKASKFVSHKGKASTLWIQ